MGTQERSYQHQDMRDANKDQRQDLPTEIERGYVLKLSIIIIIVSLLVIVFSCNRQQSVYWNGIHMSEDFVPPPIEPDER